MGASFLARRPAQSTYAIDRHDDADSRCSETNLQIAQDTLYPTRNTTTDRVRMRRALYCEEHGRRDQVWACAPKFSCLMTRSTAALRCMSMSSGAPFM